MKIPPGSGDPDNVLFLVINVFMGGSRGGQGVPGPLKNHKNRVS